MDIFYNEPWMLIAFGGFVIGFLVGMTGVGAGALTTPMLISGFGVPPPVAVGTDLLFASITKGSAAWRHHKLGNIHWGVLGMLALGSLFASMSTLLWLHFAAPNVDDMAFMIRQFLAVALVFSACAIPIVPLLMRVPVLGQTDSVEVHITWTVLFGLLLGVVVTITSVGAGAIGVAVLSMLYPRMLARRLVGTDIAHAVPLTLLAGLGHMSMGNVKFDLLLVLLIGSVPGILLGSRFVGFISDWVLRVILACVLLLAAYLLIDKESFSFLENFKAW